MQETPISAEDILIQCAAALGQAMDNLEFSDEAGRYAAEFFRSNLTGIEDWSQHRPQALEFSRRLGTEMARVTRARNGNVIEAADIKQAIDDLVQVFNCPMSPAAQS